MVAIAGVGFTCPDTVIDNRFLTKLGTGCDSSWIEHTLGIQTRRTTCALEYIQQTKNRVPAEGARSTTDTPTTLALRAAEIALSRAGIEKEAIELVVGNSESARETTPSEGQRVGKLLGVRVPAYDITVARMAFIAHLDVFANWRPEALPKSVLSLSASTMTAVIDYSDPVSAAIFGDGAGAMILTPQMGKLQVVETIFACDPQAPVDFRVESYGHLVLGDQAELRAFTMAKSLELFEGLNSRHRFDWRRDIIIGDQFDRSLLNEFCESARIPPERQWRSLDHCGDTGGAALYGALALHWDQVVAGQKILMISAPSRSCWGAAVLEA